MLLNTIHTFKLLWPILTYNIRIHTSHLFANWLHCQQQRGQFSKLAVCQFYAKNSRHYEMHLTMKSFQAKFWTTWALVNLWWNLKICWENEHPSGQFSKWRSPSFPPKTLDFMKCLWLWKAFKTSFERRSLVISLWNSAICSENEHPVKVWRQIHKHYRSRSSISVFVPASSLTLVYVLFSRHI